MALVKLWNNLNIAHRNWVKELPVNNNKNKVNALPANIPNCNNKVLNNYRLNGFKKSLIDTYIAGYRKEVGCSNKFCRDCTGSK